MFVLGGRFIKLVYSMIGLGDTRWVSLLRSISLAAGLSVEVRGSLGERPNQVFFRSMGEKVIFLFVYGGVVDYCE